MPADNNRIKICFFGDIAARHLLRWSLYFAKNGYDVHIVTLNNNPVDDYGPVKIHIIKKMAASGSAAARLINILPAFFQARRILFKIKPDIIHGQDAGGNSWIAALAGFHPFAITPWGSDVLVHAKRSKITRFLTEFALRKADIIICDGQNTKEAMIKMGIPASKITMFTFGVDVEKFKPQAEKKDSNKKLTIISTRFLTQVHNLETLIEAAAIVAKKNQNVRFALIGDGDQKDKLKKLCRDLGIEDLVEFAGRISEAEMVANLRAADIYVSTSLSESGLAASTAEAMASELPIINTDTGDIKLWIKDGINGFVIPVKNPQILAQKITFLMENAHTRRAFGKNNRKIIEEKNNYYREMAKIDRIYRELINNKTR
jgi:glycosyltransferase involved in cell wall biosynthesis